MALLATSLAALLLLQDQPPPPAASPPPPCAADEYAAFDFWLGEWDVYPNGSETLVAHSRIERLYGGCAVRENWMPLGGTGGGSLNSRDPTTGRWHQQWVGSSPGRVDFVGGPVDGGMVLTGYWNDFGGPGQHAMVRQSFTPLDPDTVRQHGEASVDEGLTWTTRYDFIYRRRAEPIAHP